MTTIAEGQPGLEELKQKIHRDRGFNCQFYRDSCLRRRIAVRMRARGIREIPEYAALLDGDVDEYDRLIDTLTINVTRFFRDRSTWEALAALVLPRLLASDRERIDLFSAGCASGEEPYSLAMLLREALGDDESALRRFCIRAVDVDAGSIRQARRATYPALSLDEVSPQRCERWFSSGPPYRLVPEVRRMVSFARSDMIVDEIPSDQSLILCRNVMIYFGRPLQERLLQQFHAALEPGGILMLGRVETLLGPARALFRPLSIRERIYQKRE